jgi:DNA-binding HxlR family transcriptional regulator
MDLLGDWWTPLVLRQAFFGSRRFDEFQNALGIGRNVLTQRLKRLVAEGLFERRLYQSRPPRYDYVLTEKGADFLGVLASIMSWGDRWLDREKGAPVLLRHVPCGRVTRAEVVCEHCREQLTRRTLELLPGPGLPERAREAFAAGAMVKA